MYSSSDSEDWLIRGYSKCPAYQKRLAAWLKSDAFKQKEEETAALRQKVRERERSVCRYCISTPNVCQVPLELVAAVCCWQPLQTPLARLVTAFNQTVFAVKGVGV